MAKKHKKGLFSWFKKNHEQDQNEQASTPQTEAEEQQEAQQRAEQASTTTVQETVEPTAPQPQQPAEDAQAAPSTPATPAEQQASTPTELEQHQPAEQPPAPQSTTPAETEPQPAEPSSEPAASEPTSAQVEQEPPAAPSAPSAASAPATVTDNTQEKPKRGLLARLKQGLFRTREHLGDGLVSLFRGKKIDDDLYEELETQLLVADVGVSTTTHLIDHLTEQASRRQLKDGEALLNVLKDQMTSLLTPVEAPLDWQHGQGTKVMLMVGVNGVGKTTTIGKLAKQYQQQGMSVMLAAGDTFRAAAVEQLQVWGERNHIPVIAQHTGADSASVIFDAYQSAQARHIDVLIADTAGRLQNKANLMEELKKIVRVMKKINPDAPHEVMLVLDAGTGQNAISQTKLFTEAVNVSGLALTKLDGTAKGGVIFAIADQFGIPIRYIGVGESIDDLRPFEAKPFVDALFASDNEQES